MVAVLHAYFCLYSLTSTQFKPTPEQEQVIRTFLDIEEWFIIDEDFIIEAKPLGMPNMTAA